MIEFVMPILGADMEAGTLVEWRRRPGERVERGEVIAEVETEKGLIEIEVFTSGVVEKILIAPGEKVPVGTVMALIREDAGAAATVGSAVPGSIRRNASIRTPEFESFTSARSTESRTVVSLFT